MCQRFPRYAPVLLFLVITAAGCDNARVAPTSPLTEASSVGLTAEPLTVRPEFLSTRTCATLPAFGVRLSVILRNSLLPRGLRFEFVDRSSRRTLPEVIALPSPLATPSLLPSSSPITIPGVAPLPSVAPSSGVLPFFVRFDCGVVPDGTLFIFANGIDNDSRSTEMRVRIANAP